MILKKWAYKRSKNRLKMGSSDVNAVSMTDKEKKIFFVLTIKSVSYHKKFPPLCVCDLLISTTFLQNVSILKPDRVVLSGWPMAWQG